MSDEQEQPTGQPSEDEKRQSYTSYSAMALHRSCPQAWNYRHVQRLEKDEPDDVRVELEFGLWWHALRAADSIERGRRYGTLKWCPDALSIMDDWPRISTKVKDDGVEPALVPRVFESAQRWWDSRSADVKAEWEKRIGGSLPDRLNYVDAAWTERWEAETKHERPLAVEMKWERVLPTMTDPETGETANPATTMVGYVDEVFYDSRRNIVVVRDHKTHKALGTKSSADEMMDSQLQVYAWGAAKQVQQFGHGPVKAVAYDRVRMVAPKQPKITQMGTLSKSVTDYDLRTYVEFARGEDGNGVPFEGRKKDGSQAGVYTAEESVIENLSDPAAQSAWVQRSTTPLNRNIVMSHLRASVDTAFAMRRDRDRVAEDGEAGRNLTSRCTWCPFVKLCAAQMAGGAKGHYDLEAFNVRPREDHGRR